MPPPSRANTFGPTMHTPSPFTTQHLVHGAHGGHAPHHLAHHQLQSQHHGLTAQQQQQSHHQQQQQQQQHQQQPQPQHQAQLPQHQNPHAAHALQQAQQAQAQAQAQAQVQALQNAAQQQQQQQQQQQIIAQTASANNSTPEIRDVWKTNLEVEMAILRDLVDRYPYIAMDTEFPGIVARPIGQFKNKADYHYQTLRCNVDLLKMIQLGLTFYDEDGNCPEPVSTWQFHFQFSLKEDMYAQDSIELLQKSGISFNDHETNGISVANFGELLISSGLVLLDNVKWLSFHSGYDFGYLVKLMTCKPLPNEETDFRRLIDTFFPALYDIKYMMRSCKNLKGGLQDIADELGVSRVGPQHQAGSDSLLTGNVFFRMRDKFFNGKIDDEKFLGQVWGLNGIGMSSINHNFVNTVGAVHYDANGQPITNGGPQPPSTPTGTHPSLTPAPITPQQQSAQASQQQPQPQQQSQPQQQQQMNPFAQGGMGMGNIGIAGMNSGGAFAFGKMGGI